MNPDAQRIHRYDYAGNRTEMKVNNVIYQGYSFNHESAFGVMAAWDSYAYRDQIAPFEYEAGNLYATTPTVDPDKKRLQRYDYAGNLKEVMAGYLGDDTARQFAYDQHNRLVWQGRSLGSNSWYLYDALGRRIQKTVGDQTTRYVYSGNRVVEEQDMAGHTIAAYAYGRGLDEPVVMQRDVRNASGAFTPDGVMETYYFHTDAQGNITYLTDEAGELVEAYSYAQETDPWLRLSASQTVPFHNDFGLPTFHDPQTGAAKTIQFTDSGIPSFTDGAPMQSRFGNPFLYNGREWDPELGFYYYRARYLDPLDGRFTTPDPLGPWGDSGNFGNPYTYTGNNPWSRTDPYGLWGLEGLHEVIGNVFYAMVPSLFNWRL